MSPAPSPVQIDFTDNGKISLAAGNAKGLEVGVAAPATVLAALAEDTPFPAQPVELLGADGELAPIEGKPIAFGRGQGRLTLGGAAEVHASLATWLDPAKLVESLELPADDDGPAISLPALAADQLYLALHWDYDISATAKGTMALGATGNATFGADAKSHGLLAVVQRVGRSTGARTAVAGLLADWQLPRQVETATDLAPGTWIIAEADGSLEMSLGARVGYDFSWIRGVELGQLAGDVGLRLELGLAATFGFQAAGRYLVALSREGDAERLRLRLFKVAKRGWSFGLDLGIEATPSTGALTPASFNDFVAGVLGIEAGQLLADLQRLSDPETSLTALLAAEGTAYAKELLGEVTGLDVDAELAEANARLRQALDAWNGLEHRAAAYLWQRLGDQPAVSAIRGLAEKIEAAPSLEELLAAELAKTGALTSPEIEWLETLLPQGLLTALSGAQEVEDRIKTEAGKLLAVLDESTIETTLGKLKQSLAGRFGIDEVLASLGRAIQATDPGQLDAWLAKRLELFLDQALDVAKLKELQAAIHTLLDNAAGIYEKARKALNRTYGADFAYRYQSSTQRQALFDVELDFSVDAAAAGKVLADLLHGRFDTALLDASPAVTLRTGQLSHGLTRKATASVSIPGFKQQLGAMTTAWSTVTAEEDDGRVLLYKTEADNQVTLARAALQRSSRFSLAASLPVPARTGLRVFQPRSVTVSYRFDEAVTAMTLARLRSQYGAYAETYFAGQFPGDAGGGATGSFDSWLVDLDKATDPVPGRPGWGTGVIGDTLTSLQLALASAAGEAWLRAAAAGTARPYMEMSLAVQKALRRLVPLYFFQDLGRYGDPAAEPLLVWAALPVTTSVRENPNRTLTLNTDTDVYWDYPRLLDEVAGSKASVDSLAASLAKIHDTLAKSPGFTALAKDFEQPAVAAGKMVQRVLASKAQKFKLAGLCNMEGLVIHGAANAGTRLAAFLDAATGAAPDPEKALEALSEFSAGLTEAFNQKIWNTYGKSALRPLGPMVFLEAARAFDDTLPAPVAMLRLLVLAKGTSPFPPDGFPDAPEPEADQVLVRQTILGLDAG